VCKCASAHKNVQFQVSRVLVRRRQGRASFPDHPLDRLAGFSFPGQQSRKGRAVPSGTKSEVTMPHKPPHPCGYPRCPAVVQAGRYCPAHARQSERQRGSAAGRGYDARWQRLRRVFLLAHPWCECEEHRGKASASPASEVHHKIPMAQGGTHDESNLMALSKPCHSRITVKESGWRS
jgi:5-methylcytosine-specific restriction enzyme A